MLLPSSLHHQDAMAQDLGSLAWVVDDLRKSLAAAAVSIRRYMWDAKTSGSQITTEVDISDLHIARRQFHQGAGALDMVGQPYLAKVLRAMEALAQKFVQWPDACTEDTAQRVEHASRALVDYLEGLLRGGQASTVALFPQHRALLEIAGAERIHPADLWMHDWQWIELSIPFDSEPLHYAESLRCELGDALLPVLRTLDRTCAARVGRLCAGLAAGAPDGKIRSFWAIAAGFFEAVSLGCLPDDIYVRRTASQVISQYGELSDRSGMPSERVAQDLLFFCALPVLPKDHGFQMLSAVRIAYSLDRQFPTDYETSPFGRFDPVHLAQARKRIDAAAETWSALAGGDLVRLSAVVEEFEAVRDTISNLHSENAALLAALCTAAENTARSAMAPKPTIAIEVATSILYLEAAYDDLDLASDSMEQRGNRLASRLQHVCTGGESQPIEVWMEKLYRRVSDRQTMGTVTMELRAALADIEKSLDRYYRNPMDQFILQAVPVHLGQMRGVFSVIGLDQAAVATLRIRSVVEQLLAPTKEPVTGLQDIFAKLVSNLSTLGFLIDMLTYQPALAKELFVYDEAQGEFKLIIAREGVITLTGEGFEHHRRDEYRPDKVDHPTDSEAAPNFPEVVAPTPPTEPDPIAERGIEPSDNEDLQDIFLSEAGEVIRSGLLAVSTLVQDPTNGLAITTLRRAFHTLKGGARMVGHDGLGDAAWAFEQLVNAGLAQQRPMDASGVQLCDDALREMAKRVEAMVAGQSVSWTVPDFRRCADRLRLENVYQPLSNFDSGMVPTPSTEALQALEIPLLAHPEPASLLITDSNSASAHNEARGSIYLESAVSTSTAASAVISVGHLQLSSGFFAVFLNEAQEWSQRLQSEVADWDPMTQGGPPVTASALAHSLQGGSAAVGFTALSSLARAMEQAMDHLKLLECSCAEQKAVLCDAAKDIDRLLSAFASRVLVEADPVIIHSLKEILNPASAMPPELDSGYDGRIDSSHEQKSGTENSSVCSNIEPFEMFDATEDVEPASVIERLFVASEPRSQPPVPEPPPLQPAMFMPTLRLPDQDLESEDLLDTELMPVFVEEARELLPTLSTSLRSWVAQPEEASLRAQSLRVLHTLKGSARLAGAFRLGEQAHRIESGIERLGLGPVSPGQAEPCLRQLDQLNAIFDALELLDSQSIAASAALLSSLEQGPHKAPSQEVPGSRKAPVNTPTMPRALASQSVRVRAQILDRLIDQSGEVMISRSRVDGRVVQLSIALGELGRNLERLRQQLRDLEMQADLQMQSRLTQSQGSAQQFDPLEFDRFTRVQEVSRMMAESVSDIETVQRSLQSSVDGAQDDLFAQGRRAKELQHDLLRMRLIEFDGISDRLYGVVRQASRDTGKQVRLDIVGGSIEVDRGMLDRMTPAFEHLLRNAIAHGIETPSERLSLGKPPTGMLSIKVHQDGSDVSVAFTDDGAGLHLEKIRARAIAANLLLPEQALSLAEAARMLFIPGFTTADQVTELAGRGIGMDVVLSEVSAVGGRIETASEQGVGTSFTVVFPLTTAVTQVVMLRLGSVTIGVPANLVETVLRVRLPVLKSAYADAALADADRPAIPFFWGGALLNLSSHSDEAGLLQHAVAVIRSAGQRVALHVDEVLGSREVVVKNLGPQLRGLPGLAGMSVLASGAVVLIYNPVALASLYGDAARKSQGYIEKVGLRLSMGLSGTELAAPPAAEQAPLVLVVDDSITVRRVTQRLLKREGFRVVLAMDGLQALELLRGERPMVVLSDIEMPRMDGLELARNIRSDPVLAELPIIVITSRIAQKHRDHAASLGVNHYLGKPYSESELVGLIRSYCTAPAMA